MSGPTEKIQRFIRQLHYAIGIENQLYRYLPAGDVIVMYHNVLPVQRSDIHLRNISQADFKKQILHFKKHFEVVSLKKLFEKKSNHSRLAITFDDGLINNLRYAAPVLEEARVPATFFITTTWINGESSLWPDELSILLSKQPSKIEFQKEVFRRTSAFHFRSERSQKTIQEVLLQCYPEEIHSFIKRLSQKTEIQPSRDQSWEDLCRIMTGDEIEQLAGNPLFEIGSHAVTHHNLTCLPFPKVADELRNSRDYLRRITGKEIESIAYPFGLYTREMVDLSESLGYTRQLAVNYLFSEDKTDPRIKSRVGLYCDRSVNEQIHQVHMAVD